MQTDSSKNQAIAIVPFKQSSVRNLQGNWDEYQYQTQNARCRIGSNLLRDSAGLLAHKRKCALAYLGKRAQLHGGVCSKTMPRILTPRMIAELEANNRAKRFSLYPWMETLMNLTAEIERTQDRVANSANVISLLPATTHYRNNLRLLARRQIGADTQFARISSRSRLARKLAK